MNKPKMRRIINLLLIFFLMVFLTGCEAFVRKFTRKPKKDQMKTEELVLVPEEYKPAQVSKEGKYREAFLFWKNWHDELIESLTSGGNRKKQIDCLEESVNNLQALRQLLNADMQKSLDIYLNKMDILKSQISADVYGSGLSSQRWDAEKLKRNIQREFSYDKIKKCLI